MQLNKERRIVEAAAAIYRVSAADIMGKGRSRAATDARHMCMLVLSDMGEYNPHIAQVFNVTVDAVRYSIYTARNLVETRPFSRRRYEDLIQCMDD